MCHPRDDGQGKEGQPPPKRQKRSQPNLSTARLTKRALRALQISYAAQDVTISKAHRHHTQKRASEPKSLQQADHYLRQSSSERLKEIRKFAKHGGPDLCDVVGYPEADPEPKMGSQITPLDDRKRGLKSSEGDSFRQTKTTKSIYDRIFQSNLIQHRVYPHEYTHDDGTLVPKPDNLDEIQEMLARPRASPFLSELSQDRFADFKTMAAAASTEAVVDTTVFPMIEGRIKDLRGFSKDVPFYNFDQLTDGSLPAAKPDIYYGARWVRLDPQIRQELSGSVIPSSQEDRPLAPNFFAEVKGPDGLISVATRQIQYSTALGARGIHALQNYANAEPTYDNNAYSIGCTYTSGFLNMFASHPLPPLTPGGQAGFTTTSIGAYALHASLSSFRSGIGAFRNARDWTEQKRNEAIDQANGRLADQTEMGLHDSSLQREAEDGDGYEAP